MYTHSYSEGYFFLSVLSTIKKARETSISTVLMMPKPLTVDHYKLENSERDGNIRPPDLPLENSVCTSGSNS